PGPATFIMGGDTYGYAPIANGIYLQTSYIYPEVAAEPGSVAPGQSLTIIADPIAPVNAYFDQAYEYNGVLGAAVSVGANVTASLVGPDGTVSKATLTYQPCAQALRVCNGGASTLYGQLRVPADATPGLYTVALYATFGTDTVSFPLEGSFYGQIMVSQGLSTPKVTLSPSTLYEGQSATITADIAYPNGTEVRFGEYSAVVYPSELAPQYTAVMHAAYAGGGLTALSFDPSLDRWTGTFNLPSSTGPGDVSTLSGEPVPQSGPFDAFVTGLSFDGVPTTGNVTAEHGFFVQPYRLTSGPVTGAQTSGLAFEGATIGSPGYFSGDVFLGSDRVEGAGVTIAYSSVNGTLTVSNSDLTLVGLSGGSIVASGSHIRLVDSDVASLSLTNSTLSVSSSSYGSISPFAPTVMILSPTDGSTFSGVTLNATVRGDQVSSVVFSLDGRVVGRFGGGQGGGFSVPVSASNFTDGEHTFQVSALQSDNITTSSSVSFATDFQEQAQLKSQSQAIDSLRFQQELLTLGVASVAIAALVIAIYATRRRPAPPTPAQAGTQTQPSQNPQLV
ncbi:MAG TPA: Ig-like domain-containing protein, partial [Nitrososphaerales archaeon]|nr:Ig-like domain-containing protein [Nitrososphaerales archaeon]